MSEKSEIKRLGAKAQKNSGRGQYQKGDARLGDYVIDIKEYPKGYRITPDNWAKICSDAYTVGGFNVEPALNIVMGEGNNKVRLFVISESAFMELIDEQTDR